MLEGYHQPIEKVPCSEGKVNAINLVLLTSMEKNLPLRLKN